MMKRTSKLCYEAPSVSVFEVEQECVICASGGTESFRDSGNSYNDSDFE